MEQEIVEITQDVSPEVLQEQKLLTQEQVNALVGREKKLAAEKVKRELELAHQAEIAKLQAEQPSFKNEAPVVNSEEEMYQKVIERLKKEAQIQDEKAAEEERMSHLQKMADNYIQKMSTAQDVPEDFKEVMEDFDVENLSSLAFLAQEMENTPLIMYELAKNPLKAESIDSLAKKSPKEARKAMKKLSESIMQNSQAEAEYVEARPPLSHLKPSKAAGVDTGKMGLKDFKNVDWLRT